MRSGANAKKRNLSTKLKAGIIASAAALGMGMLLAGMMFCRRRRNLGKNDRLEEVRKEDIELPIVDLSTIAHATDNFSSSNKLGEGGFGPVYKVTKESPTNLYVSSSFMKLTELLES